MAQPHILVVEDHPDNQQLVTWILEDEGYTVTCAGTAEEALNLLKAPQTKQTTTVEADPDTQPSTFMAVLMDISLPGMDGKQATQAIRHELGLTQLPVFALTAHALALEKDAIMHSGVNGLLTKPIDEEKLIQVLADIRDTH